MQFFQRTELETEQARSKKAYLEFLRVPALSAGIYRLAKGATDLQKPHGQDEVYYVLSGRAMFHAAGKDHAVETGSILFVPPHEEHRFHSITEDLTVLVFFAPAEST